MITVHDLPDTLRAGLTEAEKQILEIGKDQTSISLWSSPADYAHLVLEKHVEVLEGAGFSTESLGSHAASEKPELTQKSEGLAPIGETTEDEAEGSTVGGEVAGATGKAGDWMEVIKEGGSWDSARTIRAAFLGYLLGEGFFPKGLIIVGARLVGPWQWKGAFPAHGLALIGCYIEGPIQLIEANAPAFRLFLGSCHIANPEEDNAKTNSPLLLLQQTQLRSLYFEDCRIGGPIHLKGFRTVRGSLSLVKTLIPSSEVALQIENTVCEWDLWLSEAHFGGAVHLKDVKVEGEVSIESSHIESSSDVALHVEDTEARLGIALSEARLRGEVRLVKVKGELVVLSESHIESSSDVALHVEDTEARLGIALSEARLQGGVRVFKVMGKVVSLSKAHIESSSGVALHVKNVEVEDVILEGAQLVGGVRLEWSMVKGKLNLQGTHIESSSDVALHIKGMKGGADLYLQEAHLKGRVVLKRAEVRDINIQGSVIATRGPLAVHLRGVRARGLSMEEALFRWIADGSEAESSGPSDGDSLILVSIENSRIGEGAITIKNIERTPVKVVLGEGAAEGSGDGESAEKGAVRATFQVKNTILGPQLWHQFIVVAVVGAWDVEMADTEVLGDLKIAVCSAESVIMMRKVKVQRDMLLDRNAFLNFLDAAVLLLLDEAEKGSLPVGRVELEGVRVGGRLEMQGLRVEKELSLRDSWVGGGVYLEEVEVGRVETPGRLHLEKLRTVELDLSGADVRGALSLQGVRIHTYSDRPWAGLKAIEMKDFEWMVMPVEREKGLVPWHLSWLWKMPREERLPFLRRLYRTYRLRYHQPPLRPASVGYTAAERRRLRWGMRFIRGMIFVVLLFAQPIVSLIVWLLWLLLGPKAIWRFFRQLWMLFRPILIISLVILLPLIELIVRLSLLDTKAIRRFPWPFRIILWPFRAILNVGLIIFALLFLGPIYLVHQLLLLGTEAIQRFFRLFRRGRRSLSGHEEEEE